MNWDELLKGALTETGAELKVSADEAVAIIALEGARLAGASAEPGFDFILKASRDNVALKLGINASLQASAMDSRIVGIIQSVLFGLAA